MPFRANMRRWEIDRMGSAIGAIQKRAMHGIVPTAIGQPDSKGGGGVRSEQKVHCTIAQLPGAHFRL